MGTYTDVSTEIFTQCLQLTFQVFSLHLQESNLQQSARNTQHKQLMHGMICWVPFILKVRDNIEAASNLCILGCVGDDIYPPTLFVCKRIKWDGVQLVPFNSHVQSSSPWMVSIRSCILAFSLISSLWHMDSLARVVTYCLIYSATAIKFSIWCIFFTFLYTKPLS